MSYSITLIPGDGIGPEVSAAAQKAVAAAGVEVDWDIVQAGQAAFEKYGDPLPAEVLVSIERNRVALKGPLTTQVAGGFRSVNVTLRHHFELYANIRPVKTLPGIPSRYSDVDIVVFRENTEDLYAGLESMESEDTARSIKLITRHASTRIARAAFDYARNNGRRKVTVGHKANIMKLSDGLFLDSVRKVAVDYPDILLEEVIVDALCMKLVLDPSKFDVICLPNLYGDIISDLCAGFVGGLGLTPSANIGTDCAIFEAVHGSAPDIAGTGRANPIALILSSAMMLRHLGAEKAACAIESAVEKLVKQGMTDRSLLTPDLGGSATTTQVADEIARLIKS